LAPTLTLLPRPVRRQPKNPCNRSSHHRLQRGRDGDLLDEPLVPALRPHVSRPSAHCVGRALAGEIERSAELGACLLKLLELERLGALSLRGGVHPTSKPEQIAKGLDGDRVGVRCGSGLHTDRLPLAELGVDAAVVQGGHTFSGLEVFKQLAALACRPAVESRRHRLAAGPSRPALELPCEQHCRFGPTLRP
jgi:hypothetical protein